MESGPDFIKKQSVQAAGEDGSEEGDSQDPQFSPCGSAGLASVVKKLGSHTR